MGPLRGDAGIKQKSHIKYFISLWGSLIIFSFFKKGVDISKWSGINDFNFTFIEGSSAIFFYTLEMTIYQESNTTQLISLEFILATAVGQLQIPWVPLNSHWAFFPKERERQVSRDAFHQWEKKSYNLMHLTWGIGGDWIFLQRT